MTYHQQGDASLQHLLLDASPQAVTLLTGAVAALSYAQALYLLPVSLFGMSVSAAELPAMSNAHGDAPEVAVFLLRRLDAGLRRVAFFVIPSTVAFLALGDVVAAAIYQLGRFTNDDAVYVWGILAGAAIGLLASTLGRLYASSYYALHNTRTPLYYAVARIALGTGLGYLCAIPLPPALGLDARRGAAGLTFASSLAGWAELALLRGSLNRRIGRARLPTALLFKLYGGAIAGGGLAWAVRLALGPLHPMFIAAATLIPYGLTYGGLTMCWMVPESQSAFGWLGRMLRGAIRRRRFPHGAPSEHHI